MNYDPLKFCRHGTHMAPRDSFRWLPGKRKQPREVCEACYRIILAERERVKRERRVG